MLEPVTWSFVEELLAKALPAEPTPILCIARNVSSLAAKLLPHVGDEQDIVSIDLDDSTALDGVENDSIGAVVLGDALCHLEESALLALVRRCHEVLRDGGRLVLVDQLRPYDRMAPITGRAFLRWIGVRYTSDEVYSFLERSGYWDCLVLRRGQFTSDVVIRGEKVIQHASLDKHPTLSTNPTFRLIK